MKQSKNISKNQNQSPWLEEAVAEELQPQT